MPATSPYRLIGPYLALLGVIGGCESLPPAAAEHARLTRQYHEASAAVSLAAFDAVSQALTTTLETVQTANAEDWAASIALARDAASALRQAGAALEPPHRSAAIAAAERCESWALAAEATARRDALALSTRSGNARAAIAALRADIQNNSAVVSAQLAVIDSSLGALTDARTARDQAIGIDIAARIESIRRRANAGAATTADVASHADAAIRTLTNRP